MEYVLIRENDNVRVCKDDGHKYACRAIAKGEPVVKYGCPIGVATRDIAPGEHVHTHNLEGFLPEQVDYRREARPEPPRTAERGEIPSIRAIVRADGRVGIRNDVWIVPTVACVNRSALRIAEETGAFAFPHPYGCSQLGDDQVCTLCVLAGLVRHPNAGGVLVLGLGCENGNISALKAQLGPYDGTRVRFLNAQDVSDEVDEGVKLVRELQSIASRDSFESVPASKLVVGLKCGGSDGLSGVTANPLVGAFTDRLTAMGGACVMTEVPEMFGAEQILLDRCVSEDVFRHAADMLNGFKRYFLSHGQPVGENPSPGNKAGGITTLAEKSLGCVLKGGTAPVTDVLRHGEPATKSGLSLMDGPGNDPVAVTGLTAAGCHLILFTTGRGTPLGAPVPTVKIASNTALALRKPGWIDFDAETGTADRLFDLVMRVAGGQPTRNEINGDRGIAIFKDGVTL